MAKLIIEDTTLKNIANAIRNKNGESAEYLPSEMPAKIEEIQGGGGTGGDDMPIYNGYIYCVQDNGDAVDISDWPEIASQYRINGGNAFSKASQSDTKTFNYNVFSGVKAKLTDCRYMFNNHMNNLTVNLDVSQWDVSECANFDNMFYLCNGLITLDVSNWNVQNAVSMSNMFRGASWLKTLDVSKWKTKKCRDFSYMFTNCRDLTLLDISGFELTKCSNVSYMFSGCRELTQIVGIEELLEGEHKITGIEHQFYNCSKLTTLDLSKWNLNNVTTLSNIVANCSSLVKLRLPNLPKIETITNIFGTSSNMIIRDFQFTNGGTFGNQSTKSSLTFNMTRFWKEAASAIVSGDTRSIGEYYEAFANSIGANTSGLTRTIKIHTNLYNSLSDAQKALLTDKGYTLSYGTS